MGNMIPDMRKLAMQLTTVRVMPKLVIIAQLQRINMPNRTMMTDQDIVLLAMVSTEQMFFFIFVY